MNINTQEGRELYDSFLRAFQERSEPSSFAITLTDHQTGRAYKKALTGTELKRVMTTLKITLPDWE